MRKALAGSLAAVFLTAGCSSVKTQPVVNPIKVPPPKKVKNPIETVQGKAFIKRDFLVQTPADVTLSVAFKGGTLKDFADYLAQFGIVVDYDPILSARSVPPINGLMSLKELLDRVAFATNCYWEGKGRFVRFEKDKVVVYQFPIFSSDYLEALYGFESDDDGLLKAFKDDFFGSLKDSLNRVLEYNVGGKVSVEQKLSYTSEDTEKLQKTHSYSKDEEKEKVSGKSLERNENRSREGEKEVKSENETKRDNSYDSANEKRKNKPVVALKNSKSQNSRDSSTDRDKKKEEYSRNVSEGENSGRKVKKSRAVSREKLGENTEKEEVLKVLQAQYKEGEGRYAVLPAMGELVVRVTPLEESRVDQLVRELAQEVLGKMVSLKVYVVEMKKDRGVDYSLFVKMLKRAYRHEATFQLGDNNQVQIDFTNLSQNYLSGIAHGIDVTSLVNYIVSSSRAKVVSSSTLLAIPRMPARITSVVKIPFAVPTSISQGGVNPTLTYDIKTVDDGFRLRIVPSVLDDGTIVMGIGLMENRYLGDKTVQAGNVGTVTLPIQAPRKLSTVVRCRPGDVVFIGGIRKYQESLSSARNLGIPYQKNENRQYSELYILIQPKLILFKDKTQKTHKEVEQ